MSASSPAAAQAIDQLQMFIPAAPGGGWDQTGRSLEQAREVLSAGLELFGHGFGAAGEAGEFALGTDGVSGDGDNGQSGRQGAEDRAGPAVGDQVQEADEESEGDGEQGVEGVAVDGVRGGEEREGDGGLVAHVGFGLGVRCIGGSGALR